MKRLLTALTLVYCLSPLTAFAAISFDTATDGGASSGTSISWSHTTASGATILWAGIGINDGDYLSSCTYNSSPMTVANKVSSSGANETYLLYITNPSSGTHSISCSLSSSAGAIGGVSASYLGSETSSPLDGTNTTSNNSTSVTTSITTTVDGDWNVMVGGIQRAITGCTGGTQRVSNASFNLHLCDAGPKTPAGSVSLTTTYGTAADEGQVQAAFKVATAVPPEWWNYKLLYGGGYFW